MPAMKLLGALPHEDWLGVRLYSIMAHPNDTVLQDQFMAWLVIEHLCKDAKRIEKKSGNKNLKWQLECLDELRTILNAPSYSEVTKRTDSNIKEASIVGEIVGTIMKFHKTYGTTKVGVNKAIYLIKTMMDRRKKSVLKRVGERTLLKYLEKYKSVSHLWAAFWLLKNQFRSRGYPDCLPLLEKQNALLLLSVSEEIRKAGEKFRWYDESYDEPIDVDPHFFKKNICWKPPPSFKLPKLKTLQWSLPSERQKRNSPQQIPQIKAGFLIFFHSAYPLCLKPFPSLKSSAAPPCTTMTTKQK